MALPAPAKRPSSRSPGGCTPQRLSTQIRTIPANRRTPYLPCNFSSSPASRLGTAFSLHFTSVSRPPHHNSSSASRRRLRLMQGVMRS
uniref:Uncharacterized protein n=1 Tax=Zea mays TaxID=4577 RepID=B4FFG4_MAIZE|nr:unknown [Zea mays]ACG29420.1 hypothetical protein [Zea mays]|eukprot:XP_008678729.1 uncharacterized protein LOC100275641 [Zea mays]